MKNVVDIDKMKVGHKGKGKHWTKAEVDARKKAADKMTRAKQISFKMPDWLDAEAQKVWKKTIRDLQGFEILDRIDEDILAIYCDAVAKHRDLSRDISELAPITVRDSSIKAAQAYSRIALQYAEKLGITATGRARLAKKIADEELDPNAELFS